MAEETAKQEEVKEETATPAEETKEVPAKFKALVDQISELSVLDLSELVKVLEDHFGVSAAAPVAMVAGGAGAPAAAAAEEKTEFTIMLDDDIIDIINNVRVISVATNHCVGTKTTIEDIVGSITLDDIISTVTCTV